MSLIKSLPTREGQIKASIEFVDGLQDQLDAKQEKLTAGTNITIKDNVISASGGGGGTADLSDYLKKTDISDWAKATSKPTYTASEVGALPSSTTIPTKTSQLTNDSNFLTEHQDISGKANTSDLSTVATSGSYNDLTNKPNAVTYTKNSSVDVGGTTKDTYTYDQSTMVVSNGIVIGGTAQAAGLVTRGICGVTSPNATTGACDKENLYINYDGTNTYNTQRQVVLQAGNTGTNLGNNLYQYAAVRGDILKAYCDAHYLSSYTETDPVFTASPAHDITTTDISNWNAKTSNEGTITKVTTQAGKHTTVDVSSGSVSFNVPTSTSHLTNDSGFITDAGVTSVNGNTGAVTITAEGLGALTEHQDVSGKLDKSGGTMTGALVAQTNTNYTTRQVRNVIISTTPPTASDGQNGDIWIVYEE